MKLKLFIVQVLHAWIKFAESPDDAHFSYISPNQFTIEWSSPANCPLVTYDIATTDCGECPNTTSSTSITCTNLMIDGQICSIVIQTRACGNNSDTDIANLTIELRGIINNWFR